MDENQIRIRQTPSPESNGLLDLKPVINPAPTIAADSNLEQYRPEIKTLCERGQYPCFGYFSKAAVVRQRLTGLSPPGRVRAQKHLVGEEVRSECPSAQEGSVYQMTLQFVMRTSLSQDICYKH